MTAMFTYQRGAPIIFDLIDTDGAFTSATVTCKIKEADAGKPPAKAVPAKVTPSVNYVAAVGETPGYWQFTVAASETVDWTPKTYVADVALSVAGSVSVVTDYVLIRLQESVTP